MNQKYLIGTLCCLQKKLLLFILKVLISVEATTGLKHVFIWMEDVKFLVSEF